RLSDLFDYSGPVIDQCFIGDNHHCDVYNYMAIEGGEKDALVQTESTSDIYVRTAFVINSPYTCWETENLFLQNLRPISPVVDLVESVRSPNAVSVHVRMEGGRKDEHLPYENPKNWTQPDHELIDYWRSQSHFSRFVKRIDALIVEGLADTIFVAADNPEAYAEFARRYGDRAVWLRRELYDRSAEQLRYALADAILLGRASLLLGS